MEIQHDDIQLASSCSVCGKTELEKNQYKQQYQQLQDIARGSTTFSWTNIIIFIVLLLLLLGAVYLLKRPRIGRRR